MRKIRSDTPNPHRWQLYKRAILITIGGNALLALVKGFLAWITGSSAIFSDAANSASDTLYGLLMGIGLYLAQRPPDETHPQGHSRFEPLVSLFIAVAMASAGVTAIWQSIERFRGAPLPIEAGLPSIVLIATAVLKLIMFLGVLRIGKKVQSPAINASAKDNLVDIATTLAAILGVWGSSFVHPILDPVAGIVVGLWIFRAVIQITKENLGYLTGRGAPQELIDTIVKLSKQIEGVLDVHTVIAEYVGPQLRVDMHINVDATTPLYKAHDIAEEVQRRLERIEEVDMVFVHVEPHDQYD
jgi:cation diffusion facilitator family transporter